MPERRSRIGFIESLRGIHSGLFELFRGLALGNCPCSADAERNNFPSLF
jgi:hypothetical protein